MPVIPDEGAGLIGERHGTLVVHRSLRPQLAASRFVGGRDLPAGRCGRGRRASPRGTAHWCTLVGDCPAGAVL